MLYPDDGCSCNWVALLASDARLRGLREDLRWENILAKFARMNAQAAARRRAAEEQAVVVGISLDEALNLVRRYGEPSMPDGDLAVQVAFARIKSEKGISLAEEMIKDCLELVREERRQEEEQVQRAADVRRQREEGPPPSDVVATTDRAEEVVAPPAVQDPIVEAAPSAEPTPTEPPLAETPVEVEAAPEPETTEPDSTSAVNGNGHVETVPAFEPRSCRDPVALLTGLAHDPHFLCLTEDQRLKAVRVAAKHARLEQAWLRDPNKSNYLRNRIADYVGAATNK